MINLTNLINILRQWVGQKPNFAFTLSSFGVDNPGVNSCLYDVAILGL